MRHRLVVAAAAVGITIVAGAVNPGISSAGAATPARVTLGASSIHWGACSDPDLQSLDGQCAMVSVPLDYSHPGGAKIQLAVSRIRHTVPDSQFQGVMLTNPGGPGGSGLTLSTLGQYVPNGAGDAYDWIGFDPRGVGSSVPALSCDPDYFGYNRPFYDPINQTDLNAWLTRSQNYDKACAANNSSALLNNMTTEDSARDMDSLRVALGATQINYYGFSYGTYLGQVYSSLFPTHVRRMVLDSNVDPTRIWYAANLDQDLAFQGNMERWWAWIAQEQRCLQPRQDRGGRRVEVLQDRRQPAHAPGRRQDRL